MSEQVVVIVGPMRIPIYCGKGAIELIISEVASRLHRFGFRVYVYNPVSEVYARRTAFAVSLLMRLGNLASDVYEHLHLHFHDFTILWSSYGLIKKLFPDKRIRTYLSIHFPPWVTKSYIRSKIILSMFRNLRSRVLFVVPSPAILSWVKCHVGNNVVMIPNGVNINEFHPNKRDERLRTNILGNKEVLICYLARIAPEKNQLDLLRAVRLLKESGVKEFKVLLIGPIKGFFYSNRSRNVNAKNSYFYMLYDYVRRHSLRGFVIFLGEVPRREHISKILASSDIYVHTSIFEASLPLAMLEAMASGLPVITWNLVYYKGLPLNGVILVNKNNLMGLVESIRYLVENPKNRKEMGKSARDCVEKHYDWDKIVTKYYINLYMGKYEEGK